MHPVVFSLNCTRDRSSLESEVSSLLHELYSANFILVPFYLRSHISTAQRTPGEFLPEFS
jgi:hypothetical protein